MKGGVIPAGTISGGHRVSFSNCVCRSPAVTRYGVFFFSVPAGLRGNDIDDDDGSSVLYLFSVGWSGVLLLFFWLLLVKIVGFVGNGEVQYAMGGPFFPLPFVFAFYFFCRVYIIHKFPAFRCPGGGGTYIVNQLMERPIEEDV